FVKTETFFKEQGISVEDYKKMHDKLTISKNGIAEHVDLLKELTGETTEQNLQEDQNVLLKISYKNDKQNNSSSKHSGTLNPKGDSFSENMRTPQINSNGINQTEELKRLEKKKNQFLEFQKETELKSDKLKKLIERITNGKESDEIKEL